MQLLTSRIISTHCLVLSHGKHGIRLNPQYITRYDRRYY